MRHVVISPCRNEADYLARTLRSMAAQTLPPDLWLIVDDGSTDETPALLAAFAAEHPWVKIVQKADRGFRAVGPGVIEAFYFGLDQITLSDFDVVTKLDLDLDLPPRYFEILLGRLGEDPRLGTVSGKPYYRGSDGALHSERRGDEMSVGMTKVYRRTCFEDIGGFVREVMWDGIDCHACRQKGWIARSWDEPDLRFEHLRPMGSSHKGILTGRMRHGAGQWFMGSDPLYYAATCVFRMAEPPLIIGGMAMMAGYGKAAAKGARRLDDADLRKYIQRYQRLALRKGKAAATEAFDAEAARVFAERHAAGDLPA